MDRWIVSSLCALAGTGAAYAPVPVCSVATFLAVVVARRVGFAAAALAATVFALSAVRGELASLQAEAWAAEAVTLARPSIDCDLTARVASVVEHKRDAYRATVEVTALRCDGTPREITQALAFAGLPPDTRRGDRIQATARLVPVERFRNPGSGSALPRIHRLGSALSARATAVTVIGHEASAFAFVDAMRDRARTVIVQSYAPDVETLGRALVLGESDLSPEDDAAFRETGLSHLLAVSGTHLVIAVLGVVAALRLVFSRIVRIAQRAYAEPLAALSGIPLTWLYAAFTGMTGSVFRAALMTTVALLATAAGRRPLVLRVLALTILLAWLSDPLLVFDISFMLSLAATAGLVASSRLVAPRLCRVRSAVLRFGVEVTTATLGATIACAPILATISPTLPIIGVALNLVAAPIGEAFGLPLSIAHVVLAGVPAVDAGCAAAASGALRVLLWLARTGKEVGLSLPVPPPTAWQASILGGALVALATAPRTRAAGNREKQARRVHLRFLLLAGSACVVEEVRVRAPRSDLTITAIDVGQGDAILVEPPGGGAILIDAGGNPVGGLDPGARAVAPVLRSKRIARLDVVVLSHPHPDHTAGLAGALRGIDVGEVWDTGEADASGRKDVIDLLAGLRARGVSIVHPSRLCQGPRFVGGARIDVLAPCDAALGFSENTNDNSFVLRVAHGARVALLTGDAEEEAEETLVARFGRALGADLLKVGHHGSATSSGPVFVGAVAPRVAFVSCGVRNRFTHPHPRTLGTLAGAGVSVCRTDLDGACTFRTDGFGVVIGRGPR